MANDGQASDRGAQSILPLPPDGYGSYDFWVKEAKAAVDKRDNEFKPSWDRNVQSYLAKPRALDGSGNTSPNQNIVVPKDFANVEQKKAQLFFQLPQIIAKPRRPDLAATVPLAQAILRFYLGPSRVDAIKMMGECLFDALCPAGLMASKIGYESIQDGIAPIEVQIPNPMAGQPAPPAPALGASGAATVPAGGPTQSPGSVLGLSAPAQPPTVPMTVPAPRIISERYFWERISPAKILIPEGFTGSNYDLAPWLGFEFEDSAHAIKQRYNLGDDDIKATSTPDDKRIRSERDPGSSSRTERVRGREIWYKASLFDPEEKHPEKMRVLVLLDGMEAPVQHRDSPYQRFDPQTGRLLTGMRGFPIQIGALRYVSDTAYPPSEVSISRHGVDELGVFRTQMIKIRDRAVSTVIVDEQRIGGPQTLEKFRRGEVAAMIPVPNLDTTNPPMMEVAKAHTNQDNYRANDYIDRDISEVWAFGPNQRGQEADESRTATEMKIAQSNASARIAAERRETMDYFVKGATKVWSLLQLFSDQQEWVEIIGEDGMQRLQQWDKTKIAGEYVFEAKPDSAAQIDYVAERQDLLKLYEMVARDPNWNRVEIDKRLAVAYDFDPATAVVPQVPGKGPQPASMSLSFKLEDIDIGNPNWPIMQTILQQAGYTIPPDVIQQAQQHAQTQAMVMAHAGLSPDLGAGLVPAGGPRGPIPGPGKQEHPGTAPKAERLNKHQERRTGKLPNEPQV